MLATFGTASVMGFVSLRAPPRAAGKKSAIRFSVFRNWGERRRGPGFFAPLAPKFLRGISVEIREACRTPFSGRVAISLDHPKIKKYMFSLRLIRLRKPAFVFQIIGKTAECQTRQKLRSTGILSEYPGIENFKIAPVKGRVPLEMIAAESQVGGAMKNCLGQKVRLLDGWPARAADQPERAVSKI